MTTNPIAKPCRYNCGKTIIYDQKLPSPPFRETDTGQHHTYKRCAEILGKDKASKEFAKDAAFRKQKAELNLSGEDVPLP